MAVFPKLVLVMHAGSGRCEEVTLLGILSILREFKTMKIRDTSARERACLQEFQLLVLHRRVLT